MIEEGATILLTVFKAFWLIGKPLLDWLLPYDEPREPG
jgi:hypothetical protein